MAPLDLSQAQVFQFTAATTTDRAINLMAASPAAVQQPLKMAEKIAVSTTAVAKETAPVAKKEAPHRNSGDRKKIAKERSFRNLGEGQKSITAPSTVDEPKFSREWFVDDVVER